MTQLKATVLILNEVHCSILGIHESHLKSFVDEFAVLTANYFFNPRYKLGQWDGRIKFFQETGKTYINLLTKIIPKLSQLGYTVEYEDRRTACLVQPKPITEDIFSHVQHRDTGKPLVLRDYQIESVNSLLSTGNGIILASTGAGKAQSLKSKILTPVGWKLMGDMKIGERVITPSGLTASVIGVFPQGKKELYRVTFHDGSSTLCCNDHLWKVRMPNGRLSSAKTYEQVVPLSHMRDFLTKKQQSNGKIIGNISIDVIEPIDIGSSVDLPIDPYLLGVILGDGCITGRSIMVSSKDQHILDNISTLIDAHDLKLQQANFVDYRIVKTEKQNSCPPSPNELTNLLEDLHLIGTKSNSKFIPNEYKNTSLSNKLKLIQGLMDTDGTVDKKGHCSFTTVSKQLADDVQELLWSIGAMCTITTRTPTYTYNGTKKIGQLAYTLHISVRDGSILFTLPRKLERCKKFNNRVTIGRRVVDISLECIDDAQCIMIDDPSHLYITDDYIVTHNTFICAAICSAYGDHNLRTLTIVPDRSLIIQTKQDYVLCGLETGEYSGKEKTYEKQHVVSTWQAIKNNPKIITSFDVVIVDECHLLKGNVLTKLLTEHAISIPHRFGVTGTLPKDPCDLVAVHNAVGPIRYTIAAHELIEQKVLASINIDIMQLDEDLTTEYNHWLSEESITVGRVPTYKEFKDGYFGDFDAEKSYIQRKNDRIVWIANLLQQKLDESGNVLCFVDNISFGRRIVELLPNAIFVNGQDIKSPEKRKAVYDLFATRDDLIVVATVHIAGTGLSINRIFNLFAIDLGKSFIRVIQAIGRGLRKADDKTHISFYDICSDLKYGKKHLKDRIKYYKESKYPYKKRLIQYRTNIKEKEL